jgi:hypothetical protein
MGLDPTQVGAHRFRQRSESSCEIVTLAEEDPLQASDRFEKFFRRHVVTADGHDALVVLTGVLHFPPAGPGHRGVRARHEEECIGGLGTVVSSQSVKSSPHMLQTPPACELLPKLRDARLAKYQFPDPLIAMRLAYPIIPHIDRYRVIAPVVDHQTRL